MKIDSLKSGVSTPSIAKQEILDIEEIIKMKKSDIEDTLNLNDQYTPQLD